MSAPMVRALLAGKKTQTRRVVKPPSKLAEEIGDHFTVDPHRSQMIHWAWDHAERVPLKCPYGRAGDRLWVREAWSMPVGLDKMSPGTVAKQCLDAGYRSPWSPILFAADGYEHGRDMLRDFGDAWGKPRSSLHMPRWASRITLEVTEVRVQRLQQISSEDAEAEGIGFEETGCDGECGATPCALAVPRFADLWRSINGAENWDANPWVWAISFKRVAAP